MIKLNIKRILFLLAFLAVCLNSVEYAQAGRETNHIQFSRVSAYEDFPSEEVTFLLQDKKGYVWIASSSGLSRYDGYRVRTYKDNLFMPGLLTDNGIKCLAEDNRNRLWIGTGNGLNVLDMKTGDIWQPTDPALNRKLINTLYVSGDGTVWIGLEDGLGMYMSDKDSVIVYNNTMTDRSVIGVKAIYEDSENRLWVGTWANGLFRYDRDAGRFIPYPYLDGSKSAHVIFEDSKKVLWVSPWSNGLFRLEHEDSPDSVTWEHFENTAGDENSLSDNLIYCLQEDLNHTLWIGTRNGLSLLDLNAGKSRFINYLPGNGKYSLPYNELNSMVRDRAGNMWLGFLGGGVYYTNMNQVSFYKDDLEPVKKLKYSNSVRSLLVDSDGTLWLGIGSHGFALRRKGEKSPHFYTMDPDFKDLPLLHTVSCIQESRDKREIWFSIASHGIYIYDKTAQNNKISVINFTTAPWLPDIYINVIYEDEQHNKWLGSRSDLSVIKADGSGHVFNLQSTCSAITGSKKGKLWVGTNHGIVALGGDFTNPGQLHLKWYTLEEGNLPYEKIQCLFEDSKGRLWAGSESGGLILYNEKEDRFVQVNERYNILADVINSIEEDDSGRLWISTNSGLLRLNISDDGTYSSRIYTTSDGLLNNNFIHRVSGKAPDGRLYFGGHNGFNSFYPEELEEKEIISPVVITDIKIFNQSVNDMEAKVRRKITAESPDFTKKIVLNYNQNNFSIEFAVLSYIDPSRNKYAYRLEGYDKDWQYIGSSNRMANYNNLNAGSYLFRLKGANENGLWNEDVQTLQVVILPPPWKTGWAYVLYILLLFAGTVMIYRIIRNRIRQKQAMQLMAIEQAKSEEINHAKLQFFTNITHEFLTPLTILSASLDELKLRSPENSSYYQVMNDNINRLIRLLQQILEFRKAESGNLKLKVSCDDVVAFIRKETEAFGPLMKKKQMNFSFVCSQDSVEGYFDPDKLDKIIYNLLSNASKYNKVGGTIEVVVSFDEPGEMMAIRIKDDGQGISKEARKNLFKRFYEGDYRRFKTIGTGIGLSLTKDLVELHNGAIEVESEPGQGTSFLVTIPVSRSSYQEEQIEERMEPESIAGNGLSLPMEALPAEEFQAEDKEKVNTLLLVEDNEELLTLMEKLLSREYKVCCAKNGKEAVGLIESKDYVIDLVVTDVMMPEMDGVELCKYIKNNFDNCHIPVLLLTAKNQEEDRIEAYESGADGFISKPFNLSLLHARIHNLLKKKERTSQDFKKQLVFEAKELNYTSLDEDFLKRAIDCVDNHLDDPEFDQQQFMEEMATSKSTLYKKLKSLTGLNTSAFIRNIRLKAACRIIEEKKRVRISELAYAVGFNDPKYFSTCFKKEFGMLPSEYMEQYAPGEGMVEL